MNLLEVKNISKTYGNGETAVKALKDVSFSVPKGEYVAIVGESGSGKSTLLRCINQLETPTAGEIEYDGKSITGGKMKLRDFREEVGMVFQRFNLFPMKIVLENVMLAPVLTKKKNRTEAKEKAMELLGKVNMADKANNRPSTLSGEQQQQVAIARVLASDPEILLCDEATSALDPQTTKSILELIRKINKEYGITVVVITHEMSVVQEICNRVAVLERGVLVESGTVEELFRSPKTEAARRLVFSGRAQIQKMNGKRLVRVTFKDKSSFEPVIANLVLTYRTPVNILYADTKNIGGAAEGEMILQLPEIEETAEKMIEYLRETNMGVEELKSDVG